MPAPFLPDGYTRENLLEESGGRPPVRILSRPLLAAQRRQLNRETVRLSARGNAGLEAAAERVVAAVAARLVDWDVCDAAGRPLDIHPKTLAALDPDLFEELCTTVTTFDDEGSSAKKLIEGVRLILAAPRVAFRNCEHCQMYVYDERSGRPWQNPPGSGRLILRPPEALPPCRLPGIGCAKGTPDNPTELSVANQAAWRFDRECRATGNYPDDPIVRRNAALIRQVEEEFERREWTEFRQQMLTLLRGTGFSARP